MGARGKGSRSSLHSAGVPEDDGPYTVSFSERVGPGTSVNEIRCVTADRCGRWTGQRACESSSASRVGPVAVQPQGQRTVNLRSVPIDTDPLASRPKRVSRSVNEFATKLLLALIGPGRA
jgi:hypothetical protein